MTGSKVRDHYDWVVLGDHPGALLSASLAARLGLSVLVLPLSPGPGLMVSKSGQYWDPETNYLTGLGRASDANGLLAECLTRLGIQNSELEMIDSESAIAQVLTPQTRLSLARGSDLALEMAREYGRDSVDSLGLNSAMGHAESAFLKFWLELPDRLTFPSAKGAAAPRPMTLAELRRRVVRQSGVSSSDERQWIASSKRISEFAAEKGRPDFSEALIGLWYAVTSTPVGDPRLEDLLHAFALARTGASFRGGMTAFREFLLGLARRLGVDVPVKTDCRQIFVENGKLIGIQVTNRGNMVNVNGGVLGCPIHQAEARMTFSGRNWRRRIRRAPEPVGWKFTIALTVHAEVIPPGMLPRWIWQEAGAPVLEVEIAHPVELGSEESENRILFVRTVMPFSQESLSIEYQRLVAGRMIRQLTEVMPFLEFHVTRIYPDFRTTTVKKEESALLTETAPPTGEGMAPFAAITNSDLAEAYGFASKDLIPHNLLCYEGEGMGSRTGIDGLFVASSESFPSLGGLGGTVAAIESISWLAHRAGLAGPFV